MVRREVRFGGRVQGVGFRATARTLAKEHSVTGWVRNEDDNTVLLQVQAQPASVDAFLLHLRQSLQRFIKTENHADLSIIPGEADFAIRR